MTNAAGKLWMLTVTLRPVVVFGGASPPSHGEVLRLHHRAHEECFIANSVLSEVLWAPPI